MVRLCISVPDALAARVRAADFNVSAVCQRALAERLRVSTPIVRDSPQPVSATVTWKIGGAILNRLPQWEEPS